MRSSECAVRTEARVDPKVFERSYANVGVLRLRRLAIPEDMPLVHSWVTLDYARYWGMQGQSLAEVTAAYRTIAKSAEVFLGTLEDAPAFLLERYDPRADPIGEHYSGEAGDQGMHVLLAPCERAVRGFSWAVFRCIMDFLFDDAAVQRIVVEPDVRNAKIHALNRRAGFSYDKLIQLPHKLGHLAFCTRERYAAAQQAEAERKPAFDRVNFEPACWRAVNRALVRKAIAEFAHELLLSPVLERAGEGAAEYLLAPSGGDVTYRFSARVLPLEHWDIAEESIERCRNGESLELDAFEFFLDFREQLSLSSELLPTYLEEIANTLYANASKRTYQRANSSDLLHAGFQEVEAAMNEGHPAFVSNSGRVGFDVADYLRYAPEVAPEVQLVWLAARAERTVFSAVDELSYAALMTEELGAETVARFRSALESENLDPSAYRFIPVHPWQWKNKISLSFAGDLATRELVWLGRTPDFYRPQQSIRTFFNSSQPHKRYVKTALSVLNMGFLRGLSVDYMQATPAINAYLQSVVVGDSFFAQRGFKLLREVASIGYRNPEYETLPKSSPQRKMLAALWRESPLPQLLPGRRLMTMAALLHRDKEGMALLPLLIRASGMSTDDWLDQYFDSYLAPLLHAFYAHRLAFMPHGENVILELENNAVVGLYLKDLAEEAAILEPVAPVPSAARRIVVNVPESMQLLAIFTDVFDGIFRYLSQILAEQGAYAPERFWARVRECAMRYQEGRPELRERFSQHDLFAPRFLRSCLNRLQLRNNRQLLDLSDPAAGLQFAGSLENPIAG